VTLPVVSGWNTPHPPRFARHLLPQGEKGEFGICLVANRQGLRLAGAFMQRLPSPLVGEGVALDLAKQGREKATDEGCWKKLDAAE